MKHILEANVSGNGKLYITCSPDCFEDARTWGILLADVARHVSTAIEKADSSRDRELVLESIVDLFEREIESPTTELGGNWLA